MKKDFPKITKKDYCIFNVISSAREFYPSLCSNLISFKNKIVLTNFKIYPTRFSSLSKDCIRFPNIIFHIQFNPPPNISLLRFYDTVSKIFAQTNLIPPRIYIYSPTFLLKIREKLYSSPNRNFPSSSSSSSPSSFRSSGKNRAERKGKRRKREKNIFKPMPRIITAFNPGERREGFSFRRRRALLSSKTPIGWR